MTKADVLSGFDNIKICTAYNINGKITNEVPYIQDDSVEPVYIEMPGWKEDLSKVTNYDLLPAQLKNIISFIEKETGVPVTIVSVGPDRKETIFR